MIDLSMTVRNLRVEIEHDEKLQNFIKDILLVAGEEKSNRAYYLIVYHLLGKKSFPDELRSKIMLCMQGGELEKTFLRNNYEQRVYGMLSKKKSDTQEYFDFYFEDELENLGVGQLAKTNGRGLSGRRREFLSETICDYSISKAIDILVEQFSVLDDDKESMGRSFDVQYARERIIQLNEHFSATDYEKFVTQEDDEERIRKSTELSETEKKTLILARRGQGKFRANVLEKNKGCPFTGISNPKLLVASHIKPWKDSDNIERIDGDNGLALTPTYDRLFDQGYISFTDDKQLLVSSKLEQECIDALNLVNGQTIEKLVLTEKRKKYLNFHRSEKFIK